MPSKYREIVLAALMAVVLFPASFVITILLRGFATAMLAVLAAIVLSVLLGRDRSKYPIPLGAFVGALAGFLYVFVYFR
jgi:hypothetical protein